jgi:hypothetical protein
LPDVLPSLTAVNVTTSPVWTVTLELVMLPPIPGLAVTTFAATSVGGVATGYGL